MSISPFSTSLLSLFVKQVKELMRMVKECRELMRMEKVCHELMREINAIEETTCLLHSTTAVGYNRGNVSQLLVKRTPPPPPPPPPDYAHHLVNNTKEYCCGNTILHLATSRKQLQTLKVMLANDPNIRNLVDVNTMNSGRFTDLNIHDVPACSGRIDMEIDRILRGAGALRAREFANYDSSKGTVHGDKAIIKCTSRFGTTQIAYCVLLVISTMLAVITYLAPFSSPAAIHYRYKTNNGDLLQLRKSDSIITHSFVMFNSMGFIGSVAMIIFLLHEFPLKPWPQITISAMFGSYMFLIMSISPDEALPLLLLAIPFLLLAAAGKMYGFAGRGLI